MATQQVQTGSGPPKRSYVQPTSTKGDPYHGQEALAKLASRFITHLFACPDYPPSSNHAHAKLPFFIGYALHRTKLHPSVTFAALVLLQRLKAKFPSARGSSGHRLFISAYMISSKVMCDDTYSNKSWCIVAQGMFNLREVNQMEREMCSYLDWELTVDDPILSNFEAAVRRDFKESKPTYPNYPTTFVSKRAVRAAEAAQQQAAAAKSASSSPSVSSTTSGASSTSQSSSPIPSFSSSKRGTPVPASTGPGTPTKAGWVDSPNTPSPTFSTATSPATSGSPATPVGGPESNAKIRGIDASPLFGLADGDPPTHPHPLKAKMFAFAIPSGW